MFDENEHGAAAPLSDEEAGKDLQVPAFADPANPTPEEAKAAVTVAQSALAQKKHWRDQAVDPATGKKYRDLVKAPPAPVTTPSPEAPPPKVEERVIHLEQAEEKRQFGYSHKLSPEEVDRVFATAKGMGKKPAEVLDDPFVKSGIEALRTSERNRSNIPGPSRRVPVVDGKPLGDMNVKERQKNWQKITGVSQ